MPLVTPTSCPLDIPCHAGHDARVDERALAMAFGEHLRRLRGRLGISQEKLAERASLSRTSVVNIEAGRQGVALATLYRLAEALGTGPGDLLPSMSQGEGTPSIAIRPENDDSTRISRSVMKDLADRRGEE